MTRPERTAVLAAMLVLPLAIGPIAVARAQPATEPFDVDAALAALRAAYAGARTEEATEVTVRRGISSWREPFTVRIDPPGRAPRAGAACRLELGELVLYWSRGEQPRSTLVAIHDRDLSSMLTRSIDGGLTVMKLAGAILPVPVPQLALALDEPAAADRTMRWLTPYTPSITWNEASREPRRAPNDIVIAGTCTPLSPAAPGEPPITPGLASMTIDQHTGRLKRFFAEVDGGTLELELRIRPESPLPRPQWDIDTRGRTAVETVAELRPRKGDAAAANVLPDLFMQDAKGRTWLPAEAFARLPHGPGAAANMLALIFVRETLAPVTVTPGAPAPAGPESAPSQPAPDRPAFANESARAALVVLRSIASELAPPAPAAPVASSTPPPPTTPSIAVRVVAVLDRPDDQSRVKIERAAAEWGSDIVWCSTPASSIDRFAPDARAAIVFVKPDRSLCGVVPLLPRTESLETWRKSLEALVREALACTHAGAKAPPAASPPP